MLKKYKELLDFFFKYFKYILVNWFSESDLVPCTGHE